MSYKLKLDLFEGPLDLLLYLVKKNDIDITNIPIALVTEQYMEYIEMMKVLDLDRVGDFLVMAATLMQIKSKMLLPPDPLAEEEVQEDPRSELARRLLEYQQFKEVAEQLKLKEAQRQDLFERKIDEEKLEEIKEESKEVFFEASLFDLINALSQALKAKPEGSATYEVVREEYTVEKKIETILHMLTESDQVNLMGLFRTSESRIEIVCTFLAVLELIRLKEIRVVQRRVFEDIEIIRNKENIAVQPAE